MKELIEFLITDCGLVLGDLIRTDKGFIIESSKQSLVDVKELSKVVPNGFFVNPETTMTYEKQLAYQKANKGKIAIPTIGVFKGNSLEEHLTKLANE